MEGANLQVVTEPTSAWVFLDVEDPIVAWLIFRGIVVSVGEVATDEMRARVDEPARMDRWTPVSFWLARRVAAARDRPNGWLMEEVIESRRATRYPRQVSRLRGFYVFPDRATAEVAAQSLGGGHFDLEFLAEVELQPGSRVSTYDMSWLPDSVPVDQDGRGISDAWVDAYLSGRSFGRPLMEQLVEGRALVLGTDLRMRARDVVHARWPGAEGLLEVCRLGALLGSDVGYICWLPWDHDGSVSLEAAMLAKDLDDSEFVERLGALIRDSPPDEVDHATLRAMYQAGHVRVPDIGNRQLPDVGDGSVVVGRIRAGRDEVTPP